MKFKKAKNVYPNSLKGIKNVSLFFVCKVDIHDKGILKLTGCSDYQLYDNGKFVLYGPARAATNRYRIDTYNLKSGNHILVIELSGYNCNNYYYLKDNPFLKCEIEENNNVIAYTDRHFECYLNNNRYRKVARYSFQRTFSESYKFDDNPKRFYFGNMSGLQKLELDIQDERIYLPKNVTDPSYYKYDFIKFDEGVYRIDETLPLFDNRFLHLEFLDIYKLDELETCPSNYLSKLRYESKNICDIDKQTYISYSLNAIHTGFVYFDIEVSNDCNVYFIFDEIIDGKDIDFARNDCYNIVKDHSRDWKAVGLSLIPGGGWGELYKGHKWGWGIVGSEVALVGGGLACYFIGLHEKSIMDNPNETINEKELASRRYDNVYDLQPWLYGGALFIHGLNIIVAYVIDDKNQNHNLTFVPTFMPTNNTLTVGIGINYKF